MDHNRIGLLRSSRAHRSAVVALLGAALVALSGVAEAVTNPLPENRRLSAAEVEQIVRQAVAEAQARGAEANIAVVDRVGNVLAVYQMNGAANDLVQISAGREVEDPAGLAGPALNDFLRNVNRDFGLTIARIAAIAKAITGAYLSSAGNAFSTRTASQIVQENFNPGSEGLEGGPLFGVQFSQLPCSDLSVRFESDGGGTVDPTIGPKRSPLGFSADPGGLPLYEGGIPVGGIGVIADGVYGLDRDIRDSDSSIDELIALAGTVGFDAPTDLRAERIAVDGRSLRFADHDTGDLWTDQSDAQAVDLNNAGSFVPVTGYFDGAVRDGEAFGFAGSGIEPDPDDLFGADEAYVLTDAVGSNRFPPRAGTEVNALAEAEVLRLLREALEVALNARAQIRRPIGSHVEVTISVVDTTGQILGIVRTPDAPVFGIDVSLQKARSAAFMSSPGGPDAVQDLPPPVVPMGGPRIGRRPLAYFEDAQEFFGRDVFGGRFAFSTRSIGNIARPFYPDGVNGANNGPLSRPFTKWNPFGTGLQFDLVGNVLLQHVLFTLDAGESDVAANCVIFDPGDPDPDDLRLANGLQIFSGGQPIYRDGRRLIGGIGVSGDGIDQDTLVAAFSLHEAGQNAFGNARRDIRADRLSPDGVNLRYIVCPFTPFLGSDEQNVCNDL